MPVTWTFDDELKVVTLKIERPYTYAEWQRAMDAVLRSVPHGAMRLLVDRRSAGAPTFDLADQFVRYFVSHADRWRGTRAALVVSDEAAYGMARVVAIRTDVADIGLHLEVFRDEQHALLWLLSGDHPGGATKDRW